MLNITKKSAIYTLTAVLTVGAVATVRPAAAAELVTNGSFEQGPAGLPTGWTLGGSVSFISTSFFSRTGSRSWTSAATNPSRGTIAQTITGLAAGQSATLSFWVANAGGAPNGLGVSVGSLSLFNLSNQPAAASPPGIFTNFTTAFVSPSTNPTLLFSGFNDPSAIFVDDVSIVTQDIPTAVPEPSAVVGLVALGGLFLGSRRRTARK